MTATAYQAAIFRAVLRASQAPRVEVLRRLEEARRRVR